MRPPPPLLRAALVAFCLAALTTLLPARSEEPRGHGPHAGVRVGLVFDVGGRDEMPGTVITSMIKRGDVAVFDVIRDVTEGAWEGGVHSFGLAERGVGYVDLGPHAAGIPAEVKARVAELEGRVVRGEIVVPSR